MKYQVFAILFIFTALFLTSALGRSKKRRSQRRKTHVKNNSTDFDLLIFTQHWPPTVCYDWKAESQNHTCSFPKGDEEWSIHGIWPTQKHTIGPLYCNRSIPFVAEDLSEIEDQLKDKWVDVENGTKPYSFWKHEWEKHGTCAAVIEEVNTEFKYFDKGLKLFEQYDMKHVLAKVNIIPGQSYLVQTILDGVFKVLGARCQVECVYNKNNKQRYLFEIRICFDKNFKLMDCDDIVNFPTNCARKKEILYPGITPNIRVIQI